MRGPARREVIAHFPADGGHDFASAVASAVSNIDNDT
jgi:hypothetical protein